MRKGEKDAPQGKAQQRWSQTAWHIYSDHTLMEHRTRLGYKARSGAVEADHPPVVKNCCCRILLWRRVAGGEKNRRRS